jgi:ABC-2 type transport system permease protein
MKTVFRYRLARFRGQILGWGIGLALLGLLLAQFYGTIADQQEQLMQIWGSYPKEFMAFFGDLEQIATPAGYLGVEFFSYMPLIVGIFAVLMGSGLLVSDEESGRLDLIMAHPVSRRALYWGRLGAFALTTLAIMALSWLGLFLPRYWTRLDVGWLELAGPFLSLLAVLLLFGTLALLLSVVLPSRRITAMTTGLLLVASYFITSLARIIDDLKTVSKLSPLSYYQGSEAIDSLNVTWLVGLLAFSALFAVLAWWRFERRDIRVGGEGGWERPAWWRLLFRRAAARREAPVPESVMASR